MRLRSGPFLFAATCLVGALLRAPVLPAADAGRSMPPPALACARDDLTSFDGQVTRYALTADGARLAIETDWDTVEEVHVPAPALASAFRHFGTPVTWQDGEPVGFTPAEGMHATAWICLDGETPPVIDWRPGERGPRGR